MTRSAKFVKVTKAMGEMYSIVSGDRTIGVICRPRQDWIGAAELPWTLLTPNGSGTCDVRFPQTFADRKDAKAEALRIAG